MRTEYGYGIGQWQETDLTVTGAAAIMCPAAFSKSVTTIINDGVYVTATSAAHGFFLGESIAITGATDSAFNGYWVITSIPTVNTFTFTTVNVAAVTTGTILASSFKVQQAVVIGDAANTQNVGIGPNSSANLYPVGAGAFFTIPAIMGSQAQAKKIDLAQWYTLAVSGSQTLRIMWIMLMVGFFFCGSALAQPSGVQQLKAGSGITLSPTGGVGVVTVTASGGGGGATNGIQQLNGTGTNTTIVGLTTTGETNSSLTASTALVSSATKGIASSTTTSAELAFVHGVTGGIQTNLDNRQVASAALTNLASGDGSALVNLNGLTAGSDLFVTLAAHDNTTNYWPDIGTNSTTSAKRFNILGTNDTCFDVVTNGQGGCLIRVAGNATNGRNILVPQAWSPQFVTNGLTAANGFWVITLPAGTNNSAAVVIEGYASNPVGTNVQVAVSFTGMTNGTGGGSATFTNATSSVTGVVKPDGTIITVDGSGGITVAKGSSSLFGVVEVDNSTITASAGVVSAVTGTNVVNVLTNDSRTVSLSGLVTMATNVNVAQLTFTNGIANPIQTNIQAALSSTTNYVVDFSKPTTFIRMATVGNDINFLYATNQIDTNKTQSVEFAILGDGSHKLSFTNSLTSQFVTTLGALTTNGVVPGSSNGLYHLTVKWEQFSGARTNLTYALVAPNQ